MFFWFFDQFELLNEPAVVNWKNAWLFSGTVTGRWITYKRYMQKSFAKSHLQERGTTYISKINSLPCWMYETGWWATNHVIASIDRRWIWSFLKVANIQSLKVIKNSALRANISSIKGYSIWINSLIHCSSLKNALKSWAYTSLRYHAFIA